MNQAKLRTLQSFPLLESVIPQRMPQPYVAPPCFYSGPQGSFLDHRYMGKEEFINQEPNQEYTQQFGMEVVA